MKSVLVFFLFLSAALTVSAQKQLQQKELKKSKAEYYVKNNILAWKSVNGKNPPLDSFYTYSTLKYVDAYVQEKNRIVDQFFANSDVNNIVNLQTEVNDFVGYTDRLDGYFKTKDEIKRLECLQNKVQRYTRCLSEKPNESGDKLYLHKGEWILGKVIAIDPSGLVSYRYKGEDVVNYISSNCVAKIEFESGRKQTLTSFVEVLGPADWENVKIVNSINEVAGLHMIDEASTRKVKWGLKRDMGKVDEKLRISIKKKAAEMGACFVLITDKAVESGVSGVNVMSNALFGTSSSYASGNGYMNVLLFNY